MWFPSLFLVTMFLAEEERVVSNYVVKIKDNTLIKVQPTEKLSDALDLSGLSLRGLEPDAFDDLATLKNLSLANNSLSSIPRGIFSKLKNLKHLSLAHNDISYFPIAFADLNNLKTLNISHNPVKKLRYSELLGLSKSSVVLTAGLNFSSINMNVFERATENYDVLDEDHAEEMNARYEECYRRSLSRRTEPAKDIFKVCIDENGVLKSVEPLEKDAGLSSSRDRVKLHGELVLNNMGITGFDKGWYRLDPDQPIMRLNLTDNEIVEVTPEMLNDLPTRIYEVDLSRNKIERLKKDVIRNQEITFMHLNSNGITEIEDGAFAHTGIRELYITGNLLRDTMFMRTLPKTINRVHLQDNRIEDIPAGSFPNLDLVHFHLDGNLIQELRTDSLLGLPQLFRLGLSNNRISRLQRGCFQHAPNLFSIILGNNNLTSFDNGTFDGAERLFDLDVSGNKLTDLKENFPNGLPFNLYTLKCGFNRIEKLESGTFKEYPRHQLYLEGNRISRIEQGAFDLPKLTKLILDKNKLAEFDRDSFQGLESLKRLSLVDNGIRRLPKGFARNLGNLSDLDLGLNPIKRLENGDLYGLKKTTPMFPGRVYLNQVPVEAIEGGLFDDT